MIDQRTYPEYLRSNHWKFTRSKILERDKYLCVVCSEKAEEVHHINYKNWLDVLDEDLISVCEECHCKIHLAIDGGYIPSNNKSSMLETSQGLTDYSKNKILTVKQIKERTKFILDKTFCEELDLLPNHSKQLLCGVFKCFRPKSFSIFENKVVNKKIFSKLLRIKKYKPIFVDKPKNGFREKGRINSIIRY